MRKRWQVSILLLVVGLGCLSRGDAAESESIGIASAFSPELEAVENILVAKTTPVSSTEIDGTRFTEYDLNGHHFVLFLTGVSMVNAAYTTQMAIDKFNLKAILFSGIAGAVNPELKPGDVVIPDQWIHQMESAWFNPDPAHPGQYLYPERFHPRYGHFEMIFPTDVRVVRSGEATPKFVHTFPADPSWLETTRAAISDLRINGPENSLAKIQVGGTGVSGPVFLDNRAYREFEYQTWGAACHEMEGTAVAQVAYVHRLPVLIIRGISDLAGGQEGENQEHVYTKLAADNAATVLNAVVQRFLFSSGTQRGASVPEK